MEVNIGDVAAMLDGRLEGASNVPLTGFAGIEEAGTGELTFLANPAYEGHLYTTAASAVLVAESLELSADVQPGTTLIRVADPYAAMAKLMQAFSPTSPKETGVAPSAVVHADAHISEGASIGPLCHVDEGASIGANVVLETGAIIGRNATIGDGARIGPRVMVGHGCVIGARCILQAGAIIGADGFGFAPADGRYEKVPQLGNVVIGDGCEIGAGTTIDRATLGSTVLGEGVKLDNLIQVAHNVTIGKHTVIAAQTGIAGSTTIGARCMIGGQVGINGHIRVADGTKVAAKSGITASILQPDQVLQGNPARPIKQHQKTQVVLRRIIREFENKQA
ncbi:MAG: UDP-3-O-(3-hydroxymyristoyl)glucosamine N-acyltransferase [Flavobacteriales bacterium]